MKSIKRKGLILCITLLLALSIGYIVNSQSGKNQDKENYSEALDHTFKADGSDFDGIPTNLVSNSPKMIKPWEQMWDSLDNTEKGETVLVTEDIKIKKLDKDNKPIEGIKFYQKLYQEDIDNETIKYDKKIWTTNNLGEVTIPIKDLVWGTSWLVEEDPTNNEGKKYIPKSIKIFVDNKIRYLGEVDGNNLITYKDLYDNINKNYYSDIGDLNELKGSEETEDLNAGGKWLKIYDSNVQKPLYIYIKKTSIL